MAIQSFREKHINPLSEPEPDFAKGLDEAKTLDALIEYLRGWKLVASDALTIAQKLTMRDFVLFRRGLALERRGKFAGVVWAQRFSTILMPKVLFQVSIVAQQYHVPWGLAYIRLKEVGRLSVKNGVAKVAPPMVKEE